MAALSACLVDFEKMNNSEMSDDFFYKKASFISRIGSGSASRSICGPVVIWGESEAYENSNDLYAVNISNQTHQIFKDFNDTILIIDPGQKKISSTEGHKLMSKNDLGQNRIINSLIKSDKDLGKFIKFFPCYAYFFYNILLIKI